MLPARGLGRQLAAAGALACASAAALAQGFGVTPLRVELDAGARSAILTIINDGDEPGAYRVQLARWTQDAAGNDGYADSSELIYFPQQLRIPQKDRRIVRIGLRAAPPDAEQAYRLYVEELAKPRPPGEGGKGTVSGIGVTLRFGVPVFVRPAQPRVAGAVSGLELGKSTVRAEVRNSGNAHFRIRQIQVSGVDAAGASTFEQAVDGWYLLAGAARAYAIVLPADVCRKTARVRFAVKAEEVEFESAAPVQATRACS